MAMRRPSTTGLVLTFLSPNAAHSRSAVQFLQRLLQLSPIGNSPLSSSPQSITRDLLDEKHFGSSSSMSWHSAACVCNSSGTILHFLSLADNSRTEASQSKKNTQNSSHSLLSIMECNLTEDDVVSDCREQLSHSMEDNHFVGRQSYLSSLEARLRGVAFSLTQKMGREIQSSWLLPNMPSLNLNKSISRQSASSDLSSNGKTGLRELVLPFFSGYSTLQSDLSKSKLSRPLPGLYQYDSSGLVLRPLPAADEDLRLPPPSLIFQCPLDDAKELVEKDLGGKTAKIGWRGDKHRGSLIVSHPSIVGLDVRINEDWVLSSSFDEAEQAVLAGSIQDLQSSHVMSEGKHGDIIEDVTIDPKTNTADCWVEARSNVKHPSGFLKRLSNNPRIAKPPQLPYE